VFEELSAYAWIGGCGLADLGRGEVIEMTQYEYSLNQQPLLKYLKEISRKTGNYFLYDGMGQWWFRL
jgi:hypothetical protein